MRELFVSCSFSHLGHSLACDSKDFEVHQAHDWSGADEKKRVLQSPVGSQLEDDFDASWRPQGVLATRLIPHLNLAFGSSVGRRFLATWILLGAHEVSSLQGLLRT